MLYNTNKKQSSKYSWQCLVFVSSSAICITPARKAHSKWMFWQRSQTHTPPSHKELTVTPPSIMRATAAVLQHLFPYAILGYIPYVLSCLPQPDGELLTPGETRKGEMGTAGCPKRKRLLWQGKPWGGQLAGTPITSGSRSRHPDLSTARGGQAGSPHS